MATEGLHVIDIRTDGHQSSISIVITFSLLEQRNKDFISIVFLTLGEGKYLKSA